jgi:hypothetical protein
MKKILLLFLALLACTTVYCQTSQLGFKAGVNYANIGGDAAGVESRIAFHAGLFCIIKPSDHFAFQPELVFSRQGAMVVSNNDVRLNYDYINLPLMVSYYATKAFFIVAGPQSGVVVGAKITDGTDSEDIKDQINSPDLAFGIGFGLDLGASTLSLRYNAGLSSTSDGFRDSDKYPNQVLQLSAGFKIK